VHIQITDCQGNAPTSKRALSARAGSTKKPAITARAHHTFTEKKLKKIPLQRRKTSTGVRDGPCARSSGITGDHRFNGPRIRPDQLQRITLLKTQFSDINTKTHTWAWNQASAADDNTKTAAQVKTTQNTTDGSTG
jgi:hypothetical protein